MLNPRVPEHRKHKVPPMVVHSFYKYVEKPTKDEGFEDVIEVTSEQFILGPFDHPEDEVLIRMFLE